MSLELSKCSRALFTPPCVLRLSSARLLPVSSLPHVLFPGIVSLSCLHCGLNAIVMVVPKSMNNPIILESPLVPSIGRPGFNSPEVRIFKSWNLKAMCRRVAMTFRSLKGEHVLKGSQFSGDVKNARAPWYARLEPWVDAKNINQLRRIKR